MKRFVIALFFAVPLLLPAWQSFEVADVKASDPSVMKEGKGRMLPGGRLEIPGFTLRSLILFTYGVTDDMISGGPKWIGEDRFDIVAKAPAGAPDTALRRMMETLLKDHFKLVTHQEDKPMPAYVMSVLRGATLLHESTASGASLCHWTDLEGGRRRRDCTNITMEEFAKELPATGGIGIALPVSDQTELKGRYDFQFEVGSMRRPPNADPNAQPDPFDTDGPNIFAALQKIGLHLESKKVPMPVIVIDSAEKPWVN
jgi:uncharacterized protein (TIGR03435 family)